ncbi:MAG: hypothetical protein KDA85_09360, partial [Planctomycetaceae bacterium]|nr:hypothetical protein [Planctomycetaceae bacterium]
DGTVEISVGMDARLRVMDQLRTGAQGGILLEVTVVKPESATCRVLEQDAPIVPGLAIRLVREAAAVPELILPRSESEARMLVPVPETTTSPPSVDPLSDKSPVVGTATPNWQPAPTAGPIELDLPAARFFLSADQILSRGFGVAESNELSPRGLVINPLLIPATDTPSERFPHWIHLVSDVPPMTDTIVLTQVEDQKIESSEDFVKALAAMKTLDGVTLHLQAIGQSSTGDVTETEVLHTVKDCGLIVRRFDLQAMIDRLGLMGTQLAIQDLDSSDKYSCCWPNRGMDLYMMMDAKDEETAGGFIQTMALHGVRPEVPGPVPAEILDRIEGDAWGDVSQGLQLAVVSDSENTPSDQLMTISFVVRNVSSQTVLMSAAATRTSAECELRRTSKSQVQTQELHLDEFGGNIALSPGRTMVIATRRIRVTDGSSPVPPTTASPADQANVTIQDPQAFQFRNVVYLLRGHLRVDQAGEGSPGIPLTSGQVAIAFSRGT